MPNFIGFSTFSNETQPIAGTPHPYLRPIFFWMSQKLDESLDSRVPDNGNSEQISATHATLSASWCITEIGSAFPPSLSQELYLQAAFNLSMSSGTFFDTKFFVFSRRRSSGFVDRPLAFYANSTILRSSSKYFSSLLGGGFAEGEMLDLNADFPTGKQDFNPQYEYEEDSDLEDEVDTKEPGNSCQTKRTVEESSESNNDSINSAARFGHVVVIRDIAFVTWRALVFYLATGKIYFSPLRSQHLSSTSVLQGDHSDIAKPPPCSPKSMYRVAHFLGLEPLKKLAFDEIRRNLSSTNIFCELFSSFSTRYFEVAEMEAFFC